MIVPRLLNVSSSDLATGSLPSDPTHCRVAITAKIGASDGTGGDNFSFVVATPSALVESGTSQWGRGTLIVESFSWADVERDISAWMGNDMQKDAFNSIMKLESEVKSLGDEKLLKYWRYLQTSDHFYYMSVKSDNDGSVHAYFSPFPSSYEAFISFMNVVTHLTFRVQEEKNKPLRDDHDQSSAEVERQSTRANTPVWVMNLEAVPQANVPDIHG